MLATTRHDSDSVVNGRFESDASSFNVGLAPEHGTNQIVDGDWAWSDEDFAGQHAGGLTGNHGGRSNLLFHERLVSKLAGVTTDRSNFLFEGVADIDRQMR